jgi:hypothetical protein
LPGLLAELDASVFIVIAAGRSRLFVVTAAAVVALAMVLLASLLKLRRHHAVRIALTVPDIEIGAMAAGNRVTATAVVALTSGLFVGRQIAVRIA